jgi:predicted phosphoribosyltransferase
MFQDRRDAGRKLAARLLQYAHRPEVIVLALPRGGVPVAYEVAQRLGAELDVFLVRKLGVPGHEELAMAAIASGGVRVLNDQVVVRLGISPQTIDDVAARESAELRRRERLYRGQREPVEVRGRTVILVDDGLATGSTMRAAVSALRRQHPQRIVVAVPVGAAETCAEFQREADEVICAVEPTQFLAVGYWYDRFDQTTDEEVQQLLAAAEHSSFSREHRHDSQTQVR